jgi:hypothetical protein
MKVEELGNKESIIASLASAEKKELAPAGYIPVTLSTKGKVGAPALFHLRNFKTRDIMSLALTEEEALPERLLTLLQDLIYEKDVDVKKFHENEIVETVLTLYSSFYSDSIEIPFPLLEEDYEYVKNKYGEAKVQDLKSGLWKPQTIISISKDVDTYDIDANFNSVAIIKSKQSGFTLGFRLPYYGDALVIKKWLRDTFGDEERRFQDTARALSLRQQLLKEASEGKQVNWDSIPNISSAEEEAYNNFQIKRAGVIVDVIRALHLYVYEGDDVSGASLSDRYEIIQDPRIDEKVARKLDNYFENLEFGVKPEVRMLNPLTNEVCLREYSFRLVDILQAASVFSDDEYEFISLN